MDRMLCIVPRRDCIASNMSYTRYNNSNKYQMLNEFRETKDPAAEVLVFD